MRTETPGNPGEGQGAEQRGGGVVLWEPRRRGTPGQQAWDRSGVTSDREGVRVIKERREPG